MDFVISASTDIGIKKNTNQDSLTVKKINTPSGKMVFALLCDGMGGLSKGEVASAEVIYAFDRWVQTQLPILSKKEIDKMVIFSQWKNIIKDENAKIKNYGKSLGINLGTTVVAMLITETDYYIMNVGDSRAYEIQREAYQITKDQTLVAKEIENGNLTVAEAEKDPRRSVLLQCVGAVDIVEPDFFFGETRKDAVYMLCSDGFRHEITSDEIYTYLNAKVMTDEQSMKKNMDYLINLNKSRMEQDNISVISIRTF